MQTKYVTLGAMAEAVGLPTAYLRELAESRKIPCLFVNGRLRFNPAAVEKALAFLASGAEQSGTEGAVGASRDAG